MVQGAVVECPLCGSPHQIYLFSRQRSRVMRCGNCGLVRLDRSERPAPSAGPESSAAPVPSSRAVQRYAEALARRRRPGSLILVAAPGHPFAAAAPRLGFTANRHLDAETFDGSGELAGSHDGAAILFQLERADNPVTMLERIHTALAPGAALLVATPSLDSWPSRLLRGQWSEWIPEHRYYFDSRTIQSLLLRAGFSQIEITADRRSSSMLVTALRAERRARPVLSIVMPVFNERATFERTLEAVLAKELDGVDKELVIVESRSTDGTRELVQRYEGQAGVRIILEDRPRGKGAAVRTGLQHATGDIVLIQDADDEYDVNDYDALIEPILSYQHAFVLGSRHTGSWKVRTFADQPAVATFFNFGHVLFRTALNVMYGQKLDDPFTMYKVLRRDCLHRLHFECNRFDFDFELVIKLLRKGYVPVEIPVNYRSRSFSEGKKVSAFRDPLTWIRALVKYRFASIYEP